MLRVFRKLNTKNIAKQEKTMIQKDTCTPMFIAAVFTIARTWKQPKCPSREGWIKKMWYLCKVEYYSAVKRNKLCHLQRHGWTRDYCIE